MAKVTQMLKRIVASLTAGALIVLAPGLDCYRVLAAGVVDMPVENTGPATPGSGYGVNAPGVNGGAFNGVSRGGSNLGRGLSNIDFRKHGLAPANAAALDGKTGNADDAVLAGDAPADAAPAKDQVSAIRSFTEKLTSVLSQKDAKPEAVRAGSAWENILRRGGNGVAPQGPYGDPTAQTAETLAGRFAPGTALSAHQISGSPQIVQELVLQKKLIELPNGKFLLAIPAREDAAGARRLEAALSAYDPAVGVTWPKAIAALEEVRAQAEKAPEGSPAAKNRALAEAMIGNLSVRLFDQLADTLAKGGDAVETSMNGSDLEHLREQFLSQAYFAVNETGPAPTKRSLNILGGLLEGIKAPVDNTPSTRGTMLMKDFLMDLRPASAKAPVIAAFDTSRLRALNQFGTDLTKLAREGKLKKLIGRDKEIKLTVEALARWTKNNPVLVGEHGVGKTQIAEGLAQKVADGEIPTLAGKVIYRLDLGALVGGTGSRGQFEERVVSILQEVRESKGRVILFIDEIHRIVGLGSTGDKNDAANMIKEALQSGELTVIGATTLDEYRRIEKDGALERRFIPIRIQPPGREDTLKILAGVAPAIAAHNRVNISPEAVTAAVDLSDRYLTDRNQPDKAIDLLVAAAAYAQLEGKGEVTAEQVALKVSEWTGVPAAKLTESDRDALRGLEAAMKARVVHQDAAIAAVAGAVRRARMGYTQKKRPKGRFLFLGPTGVGKTEVARVLAQQLFGSKEAMLRIDMSEYMDKYSVARLIGAPPGYIGYDEPGQLTEAIRRKPYTVLVFDEVEKADPKVLDLLLQILEEGNLTDGHGRRVDFSNTYVILTSNAGTPSANQKAKNPLGIMGAAEYEKRKQELAEETRSEGMGGVFRSELHNRLDEVVTFNALGREDIAKILDLQLADLNAELAPKRLTVELTAAAKAFLVDNGFDPRFGARHLERAIQKHLKDPLVTAELDGAIAEGDRVIADVSPAGDRIVLRKAPVSKGERGSVQLGALLPLLAVALIATPFITFALPVPVLALQVASVPVALAAPVGLFAALIGVLHWTSKGAPAGERPAGSLPAMVKGGIAAVVADMGTKAFAALVLPKWIPGFEVAVHTIGGAHLAVTAGAVAAMIGIVLLAQRKLGQAAAAIHNPAVRSLLMVQRWVGGAVIGAAAGQFLEAALRGGVIDWIWIGGAIITNVTDLVIWGALAHTFMTTLFVVQAQRSQRDNAPLTLPSFAVFVPVFGLLAVSFGKGLLTGAATAGTMFVYAFFVGAGLVLADASMYLFAKAYNRAYRETSASAERGARFRLPLTWRLRRQAYALLSLVPAFAALGAPRLPVAQARQLLQRFQNRPPKLIVMDYDWTLQTNSGPRKGGTFVSAEVADVLDQVHRAGSLLAISTDRFFEDSAQTPDDAKASIATLLMERLKPEVRRDMLVAVNGGGEIYQYNGKGDKPKDPIYKVPGFSPDEQATLSETVRVAMAAGGIPMQRMRAVFQGHKLVLIPATADESGKAVVPPDMDHFAKAIRKGLAKGGLPFSLELRTPTVPTEPKYVVIRKTDKSAAIQGILKTLAEQGVYVDPSEVLILGDETGRDGLDLTMAKAVPQATMISVGKRLDPTVSNAYLWPETGPASTLQILKAIGEHYAERNPEHVFSYSQIALRKRSLTEFRERYGKGRRGGGWSGKEALPAFVGRRAHETMQWLYAHGIPGRDLTKPTQQQELLAKAEQVYNKLWDLNYDADRLDIDAAPYDGLPDSLKDLDTTKDRALRVKRYKKHGWDFVKRHIEKYMPFTQDKSVGMEHRIYFHIQGPLRRYEFQAIIDRVSLSQDGFLEIHEYKTGREPKDEKEFKSDLQMLLYAIGMREVYPEYRRLRVRLIRHGVNGDKDWEPSEAELEAARLEIAAEAEAMLEDMVPAASSVQTDDEKTPDNTTLSQVTHPQVTEVVA